MYFLVQPVDISFQLKIYNIDVNRKHKIIGQVLCGLKDLDLEKSSKIEMAMDISKYVRYSSLSNRFILSLVLFYRNSVGDKGSELLLSLCYNPSISRLPVNVFEAKDLRYLLLLSPCPWNLLALEEIFV